MKAGDKVHIEWIDGEQLVATFRREERGYIVVRAGEKEHACLPAHLKQIEVINE